MNTASLMLLFKKKHLISRFMRRFSKSNTFNKGNEQLATFLDPIKLKNDMANFMQCL
jgi:hypothetical protein